jgi:hypothetical protein
MVAGMFLVVLALWLTWGSWPRRVAKAYCCGCRGKEERMNAEGKQLVDDGREQAKLSQEKKANSRTGLVEGQRAGVELEYQMAWEIPRRVRRAFHELNSQSLTICN